MSQFDHESDDQSAAANKLVRDLNAAKSAGGDRPPELWRVGKKVPINVYEGDRPVCQCHTVVDAQRIVEAMNVMAAMNAGTAFFTGEEPR